MNGSISFFLANSSHWIAYVICEISMQLIFNGTLNFNYALEGTVQPFVWIDNICNVCPLVTVDSGTPLSSFGSIIKLQSCLLLLAEFTVVSLINIFFNKMISSFLCLISIRFPPRCMLLSWLTCHCRMLLYIPTSSAKATNKSCPCNIKSYPASVSFCLLSLLCAIKLCHTYGLLVGKERLFFFKILMCFIVYWFTLNIVTELYI